MKKAYGVIDNYRHPELVSGSKEMLKQVQHDAMQVQHGNCRHSESLNRHPELTRKQCKRSFLYSVSVSGSLEIPKKVRNDRLKAFTLAEIMIVLSVIAVLTAILLPAARNATPNEDILKFKKGHNAFYRTISELVNSDKYYLNGDLGIKLDGELLNPALNTENAKYLCSTFADIVSAKYINCQEERGAGATIILASGCSASTVAQAVDMCKGLSIMQEDFQNKKNTLDNFCMKIKTLELKKQIITPDKIWFWDNDPQATFGITKYLDGSGERIFSSSINNDIGLDVIYKVFCMDIDGVPDNATSTDCVNECPFGYGIRADGKILNGARVDEWLAKSIQDKD